MPTENERKYVLDLKIVEDWDELKKTLGDTLKSAKSIQQAYLYGDPHWTIRLRDATGAGNETHLIMCLKYDVGERVVEIEQHIDERDFVDLWPHSVRQLHKYRYDLHPNEKDKWEIDFFLGRDGQPYFVMAEHEMPEGQAAPATVPFLIRKYLLYTVPQAEQFEFSSYNLADPAIAREVYQQALRAKSAVSGSQSPEPQLTEPPEDKE